ncbi:hypothetical protein ACFL46_04230 [Candidatus Neomarinimicrobiota bacterium]
MKRLIIIICLSGFLSTSLSQNGFGLQGALGFVTLDDQIWGQFALRPVIPIWKLKIALDLVFYIDEDGNIHQEEWDFSNNKAIKNTLIDKIFFIQFGKKNEPLYIRAGILDHVTLGYGGLVYDYSNSLLYPDIRKVGLDVQIQNEKMSLQGFTNDFKENFGLVGSRIQLPALNYLTIGLTGVVDRNQYLGLEDSDYDGRPDLVDDFPNNNDFWLDSDSDGLSDNNPDEFDRDGDGLPDVYDLDIIHDYWDSLPDGSFNPAFYDSLPDQNIILKDEPLNVHDVSDQIVGIVLDIGIPIINEKHMYFGMYSQYAKLIGKSINPKSGKKVSLGSGLSPIGVATRIGPVGLNLEYRMIPQGNFDFEYWNRLYEHNRAMIASASDGHEANINQNQLKIVTKESTLGEIGVMKGIYARINLELSDYLYLTTTYQNLVGQVWKPDIDKFSDGNLQSFLAAIELSQGINRIENASAFYQQRNVPNPFDFQPTESTVMGYNLGVKLGFGIILNYTYRRTYQDKNGDGDVNDSDDIINITIIEARFGF